MKIFIGTPMYGGMAKNNYVIGLQNLIVKLSQNGHQITTTTVANESLITRARNTIVHKFLKTDADALLFIDADHGFNPDDIVKMIESEKELIGAPYPMKGINWENIRLAALAGKQDLEAYSGFFAMNLLKENQTFDVNEPFKVKDIGTGMLFIKREVFEKLKPLCETYNHNSVGDLGIQFGEEITEYFFTKIDENKILLSEDYAFCRMWQDQGGEVWSAPWVRITHSGDYNFAGRFANMLEINQMRNQIVEKQKEAAANSTVNESTQEEEKEPSE